LQNLPITTIRAGPLAYSVREMCVQELLGEADDEELRDFVIGVGYQ
jgi:hypothetical protein